jgi:hypothetical protein
MAVGVKMNLIGVEKEFARMSSELITLINGVQRASGIAATADLQLQTPVDTGRARGSWTVGKSKVAMDAAISTSEKGRVLGPVSSKVIETLYITNGTPYIQLLNDGSSSQAPPRFIEKTLSKYFTFTAGSVKYT